MVQQQFSRRAKKSRKERQANFRRQLGRTIQLESLETRHMLAGTPQLLGDIGVNFAHVDHLVPVGATTFFTASTADTGAELWKTDGTLEGTVLVKDIAPGRDEGRPRELTNVGGVLFFTAVDDTGVELWKSDGSEAGTVKVKDIRSGETGSYPSSLTEFGGELFFEANDGINGRELWKSDGTSDGTELVADINPTGANSMPDSLTVVGSTLFFRATGPSGRELYKTDGTTAGTELVKDIDPLNSSNPSFFRDVGGTLFFRASDGVTGDELWKSDGTETGTVIVKDIVDGASGSAPASFVVLNGILYFQASSTLVEGSELWKSDGTPEGTELVKDIQPGPMGSHPSNPKVIGSEFFFRANDGVNGYELWKSDGSEAGTVLIKDIHTGLDSSMPYGFVEFGGDVFFTAYTPSLGTELWKTDGSELGTVLVRDIEPGPLSSYGHQFTNMSGTLVFAGLGDGQSSLLKSDGTEQGTSTIRSFISDDDSFPEHFTEVNGVAFFTAGHANSGYELWKSDGTVEGTVLVKDIRPGAYNGSYPSRLVNVGGTLYFEASDDTHGSELWKSDGTEAGTVRVKDISPGIADSRPDYLTNFNGSLYFSASDGEGGYELWKSDGTSEGTVIVKDINPGPGDSTPFAMMNLNGTLYFAANDGTTGYELWKSDGTEEGTVLIKDINPSTNSWPYYLTNVGGTLFFQASDGTTGIELWKSDGTEEGTVLVKDINPTEESRPAYLVEFNGQLFFRADDGVTGIELWRSDGTEAGTVLVKDIQPGPYSSYLGPITNVGGKLLFSATDGVVEEELWGSDGTEEGTVLIKDIRVGPSSSDIEYPTLVNGTLFFSARSTEHGFELWQTDGTEAGTELVFDIVPGTFGSFPSQLAAINGRLFFNANDLMHGYEPWMVVAPNTVFLPSGGGTSSIEVDSGTGNLVIRDALGNVLFDEPLSNVPELFIHGQDNIDDVLTLNFTNGNPIPAGGITFHGGAGGFDTLNIVDEDADQDADTIIHRAISASDGVVEFDFGGGGMVEATIHYTGLEPVTDNLDAVNRVFQFTSPSAETITLSDDDASTAGFSQIASTASELMAFANPTGSLKIETSTAGGSGADGINLEGLDPDFAADLTVQADGDDTVTFQISGTDSGGGAVVVIANDIHVNAAVTSGGAAISLTANNDITFSAGGSLDHESGTSTLTLIADDDLALGGGIVMAAGATINAADGEIDVTASDAIVLGELATSGEARITTLDAISVAAAGVQNIRAAQAAIRAETGINVGTQVASLAAATTDGDVQIVNSVAAGGGLAIATVDGLSGVTSTTGSVHIRATSLADGATTLTIENDVNADGGIELIVDDASAAGGSDNLTVATGAGLFSVNGMIELEVGDDFVLETGATLSTAAPGGITITLDATATDPDGGPDMSGSSLNLLGIITAPGGTVVTGGDDADEWTIATAVGSTGAIQLQGGLGDDQYDVTLGRHADQIELLDASDEGDDKLILRGSANVDEIIIEPAQTTTSADTILYNANLDALDLLAGDSSDTVTIGPSLTLAIHVFGGDPTEAPGDTLMINMPAGESSTLVQADENSGTIVTTGGFLPVSYNEFESFGALILNFDATSISENGGTTTGTVTRLDSTGDLTVDLLSDDTSEATVVATVTFLDGETTSSQFTITGVDDDLLDGTQIVSITVSAAGHVSGQRTIEVTDQESLTITIAAASIAENAGATATLATVTRSNTNISEPLEVTLANSDASEIDIPVTVIIPANETLVTFAIAAVDDSLLDGTQTATITASATGYQSANDSVEVTDVETLTVVIAVASIREDGGTAAATATITRSNTDISQSLEVTLLNSDDSEIAIPSTVTILANETSVTFNINAVNDTLLDGTQNASITASATGYVSGQDSIEVTDHETLTVVIATVSVVENDGEAATTATVTRSNTDISQELVVSLVSSDPSEINVPATVTIPADATSVTFNIDAIDDSLLDDTQSVVITASAAGYIDGQDTLDVTDHELLTLTFATASIGENAGAAATTGTVTRGNTDIDQELTVTLTNGDASELGIPATVTIPATESSITFDVDAVDDTLLDGSQLVSITASASGYISSNDAIDVTDHETLTVAIASNSISENGGSAVTTATVTRSNTDNEQELIVTLANGDDTEIGIPATVTIPANEFSVTFDIAAVDDSQVDGTQTAEITASALGYVSGVDSVDVTDVETLTLTIAVESIAENGGSAATTAIVTRNNTDISQELVVTLTNGDATELSVPSTVTIPAGETSINFNIDVVDDTLLDGTQTVSITASASGYESASDSIDVNDFETLTLVIDPVSITENAGSAAATATVTRSNTDIDQELIVALGNSDATSVGIPATVTIPANEASVTFQIDALDDSLLDGTQTVTITAAADGYESGDASVEVTDHETLTIVIAVNSISESDGEAATTATVTRGNTDRSLELVVTLTNSDPESITIPVTVTIPADQESITFDIAAVDDTLLDGTKTVTISASAAGYETASDSVDVTDLETLAIAIDPNSIVENAGVGAATATLTRGNTDVDLELVVTLSHDDASEIDIPVTVTIPAGESSVTFPIAAVDDSILDGLQTVTITATAAGYPDTTGTIDVLDHETLTLVIATDSVDENAGGAATTATVTRNNTDISQELVVTLTNGDSSEIGIPATVTIPANETSVTFDIDAVDDTTLDGTQTVTIDAVADGYESASDTLDVLDHEFVIVISAPSIAENAGTAAATATITRASSDLSQELIVNLANSDATTISIPSTVTILANETSVTFDIDAIDDTIVDGTQTVTITATADGFDPSQASIEVTDFEAISLTISVASISENAGAGAATGTVTRGNTDIDQELIVTLTNGDPSEISIPATVTIPANESSVTFNIDAVNDAELDGTQAVTITASAAGLISDSETLDVTDHEILITVSLATFAENAGAAASVATVSRGSADLSQPLVVTLTNSDDTAITIPISVTIPAGETSVTFDIDAVDDALLDGPQTATITATADGLDTSDVSVEVTDHEALTLVLALSTIGEDAGTSAVTATVTRSNTDIDQDLVVTLTNSDLTEVGVPETVVITAGESFVVFEIDAVDDTLLDGIQTVTITASAAGYESSSEDVEVTDHETLTIVIADPAVSESAGVGATTATVTRSNTDISQELIVTLTNDDPTEIGVPATVTIPAGESSVTFAIDALDDTLLDGAQLASITVSAEGYVAGTEFLEVTDEESLALVISVETVSENGGTAAATATVTRGNTDTDLDLVVTLTSSDASEIEVPATVTIPAGESSVTFEINALDDTLLDGPQNVTIAALAAGYAEAEDILEVTDHETLTIEISRSTVDENAGTGGATATVTRSNTDTDQELVVTLTNDNPGAITIPATVTIAAGEMSATFQIDVLDDDVLDGDQTAVITASANGYVTGSDTLEVTDFEALTIVIADASILESAGAAATTATVTRGTSDISQELVVTLSNGDPSEIDIPATVTIPADEASVTFDIGAVDDVLFDGTQTATITVSAAGFVSGTDTLDVLDQEPATLNVVISVDSIAENAGTGAATATITRLGADPSAELIVTLTNNNPDEISIPATVTIPANETSVTINIDAIDDAVLDGSHVVTITATADGFADGTDTLEVTDHETLTLTISATTVSENAGAGAATATVTRGNTDVDQELVVTLTNGDASELGIPATVTIPANETSITFQIDAVNDDELDGTQSVSITASAAGYISSTESLDVTDHELVITVSTSSFGEGAGATASTATITRAADDVSQPLVVTLANSDSTAITIPESVTIPAGETSVTFDIGAVDDSLLDGTQTATITASADGFDAADISLEVTDQETLTLVLSASSIAENAGTLTATVSRGNSDIGQELVVTLGTSDLSAATVPATVTIPANESSVTFEVAVVDDTVLDGAQSVTITASAAGYADATDELDVTDVETLTIVIAAASVSENAGTVATTATVTRGNTDIAQELIVTLTNGDPSEIAIPATVTIPAGETSISFEIGAVDDTLFDGTQTVTITVSAAGYVAGTDTLEVLDVEPASLAIAISADTIAENAGTAAATATITRLGADLSQALVVTLSSSDASELGIPASVTIPANESSVTFEIAAVDDDLLDGSQTVAITASAEGLESGTDTVEVTDHELLNLVVSVTSISENAGTAAATATVSRGNSDIDQELVVTLTSNDASEISIPVTVTIPAGESSATFEVAAIDDALFDGTQSVTITASAEGYVSGDASLDVTDHETLTLVISVNSVSENAGSGAATATITRGNLDISQPLVVTLTNSDDSEISIPATITIPADEPSVTFEIGAEDDALLDGTQTVTITATATGYVSASDALEITDHESLTVVISADTVSENAGSAALTATVTRGSSEISQPLEVTLTSSNAVDIGIPATVTIPAGESSATFAIDVVDNGLVDGSRVVTITATATGYVAGQDSLEVTDHELLTVVISVASIAENAGTAAATATVTRGNADTGQPLVVTLSNSSPNAIGIPETVTIPANETSVTFDIAAIDDTLLDGTQAATITASAAGYVSVEDSIDVTDHETLSLTTSATSISENGGNAAATATVTRSNTDLAEPLVVTLATSEAGILTIPETVTIPAGEASVTFDIGAVDDTVLDGTHTINITATAAGYVGGSRLIEVLDHETLAVTAASASIKEGSKTIVTVQRNAGQTAGELVVNIAIVNGTNIIVPQTVTIPADQGSATFELVADFGSVASGTQTITVEATATGYVASTLDLEIVDNQFPWQNPGEQYDANRDGEVTPIDALVVINELNARTIIAADGKLPDERPIDSTRHYYDVNGDGFCTPQDVLVLVNELNRRNDLEEPEGEGEFASSNELSASASDAGQFNLIAAPTDHDESTSTNNANDSKKAEGPVSRSIHNDLWATILPSSEQNARYEESEANDASEESDLLIESLAEDIAHEWFN